MGNKQTALTNTEWNLMECLWSQPGCSGRDATVFMEKNFGWSRSTTLTMLRRMAEKGAIQCVEGEMKTYLPLIKREDAAMHETDDFLNRVYKGSVSMMINVLTSKQKLSKEEVQQLYDILKKAEEDDA